MGYNARNVKMRRYILAALAATSIGLGGTFGASAVPISGSILGATAPAPELQKTWMFHGHYRYRSYGYYPRYGGYGYSPYGTGYYGGYYGSSYYGGYYGSYYGSYYGISGFTSATSYEDADVDIDSGDDGDEITVDDGDIISIILTAYHGSGYYYVLDDDDLDDDIVDFDNALYLQSYSSEQWLFEAVGPGPTTITLEYTHISGTVSSTFEVDITVEE